jgi:molybdate transport system regulatory protein
MEKKFRLDGRIWIGIGGNTSLGEGKAQLLRKTAELGSLRKASLELGLSYRQAWYRMNQLNRASAEPLILLHRGGKEGGLASITEFGKKMLEIFDSSQVALGEFLDHQNKIINGGILT